MRKPLPPGHPVTMERMRRWLDDFSGYRHQVPEQRVDRWLSQFDPPHIDIAARILDSVDFISNEQVSRAFRNGLISIPGWNPPSRRRGKWRFAAFSRSAGESGDAMVGRLRHGNNLASRRHDSMFVHRSDLLTAGLTDGDKIIFVDDFSGTGTQVSKAWPMFQELIPEGPEVHLLLVAATSKALSTIRANTGLTVHAEYVLQERDAFFSDACSHFTHEEKQIVRGYCNRAGSSSAAEFADAGQVIVFGHTCPNNTLPILHAVKGGRQPWEGLFRRYD